MKHILILSFIVILLITLSFPYFKSHGNTERTTQNLTQTKSLNKNISPELEQLADNTVIYLALKDSFILPDGYKIDSQIIDKSILLYPKDQKNIKYDGLKSLESFRGIFIASANTVKNSEEFVKINEEKLQNFKKANPDSNAVGQMVKDGQGKERYVIKQTKPFKMIETILNKEVIIEIVSFEENEAYKKIVETYNASELINNGDHKGIYKLQKDLVDAYENRDANKVFSLLSLEAQKNNPIEKIKTSVETDLFKDKISLEPTAFHYFDRNFILQSKVIFNDNYMTRLDISFKVDYDGEKNNWLIDSYVIRNKEKYLSRVETGIGDGSQ